MFCTLCTIEVSNPNVFRKAIRCFSTSVTMKQWIAPDNFKALKLPYKNDMQRKEAAAAKTVLTQQPKDLDLTEDWTVVWPVAKTFHPEFIKFPLRQGYPLKSQPPTPKEYSIELLKIPNFLHLSPVAIKKHCAAIKKFCTKWPEALDSEDTCSKHFPMEVSYSDYCFSGPVTTEPLARVVTIKLKLSCLNLDAHAKDKFLRLVGDRYDHKTDVLTITADRCPTRKQNMDYIKYILTALYHESKNVEDWEAEKSEEDMEYYDWDKSQSAKTLLSLMQWPEPLSTDADVKQMPRVPEYKNAVSNLVNEGEDSKTIASYKEAVIGLVGLKQ